MIRAVIASIPPRSDPAEYTRRVVRSATAHPDPDRFGRDLRGWVGTDAIGYEFGPAMLAAMEEGTWVSYVYRNPASGGDGAGFCPRPALASRLERATRVSRRPSR